MSPTLHLRAWRGWKLGGTGRPQAGPRLSSAQNHGHHCSGAWSHQGLASWSPRLAEDRMWGWDRVRASDSADTGLGRGVDADVW